MGNLASEVTEEMLARVFSGHGELESVKLMLPRSEEDRRRKRNCAFVKYYKYEAAYLAKEELGERFLCGQQMRICWAKGINAQVRALGCMADYRGVGNDPEVEMAFIEDQLNHLILGQNLPSEADILAKDALFFDPSLPRIYVKLPLDPVTRYQIDKVAKQVAKEGQAFEEAVRRVVLKRKRVQSDVL